MHEEFYNTITKGGNGGNLLGIIYVAGARRIYRNM
jgi:hypothetical protein